MTDAETTADETNPDLAPEDLAGRVRRLRASSGLTQAQLAGKVGYTTSTISKAENFREGDGMTGPRITIIEALTGETVQGPFYRQAEEQGAGSTPA